MCSVWCLCEMDGAREPECKHTQKNGATRAHGLPCQIDVYALFAEFRCFFFLSLLIRCMQNVNDGYVFFCSAAFITSMQMNNFFFRWQFSFYFCGTRAIRPTDSTRAKWIRKKRNKGQFAMVDNFHLLLNNNWKRLLQQMRSFAFHSNVFGFP